MQNYKNGKWAKQIIAMQNPDGGWDCFHTLRGDSKIPFTTETALSRLELLGYTAEDACIKKAIAYMEALLASSELPEGKEKSGDFTTFVDLIIAARIRRFTNQSVSANKIAENWAKVITSAFCSGAYSQNDYEVSYLQTFGRKPKGGRLIDFVSFYQVSLVCGMLDKQTECLMLDYILEHESGIYYVYESRLDVLPEEFSSKKASRYLAAIELLARYESGKEKLSFVHEWLKINQLSDGTWDMGATAKDGVFFPLSDRWNTKSRVKDCTYRIGKLVDEINRGGSVMQGYCGHDCAKCVTYLATQSDSDILRKRVQRFYKEEFGRDIPLGKLNCAGCKKDNVFEPCLECPFRKCCKNRGIEACNGCSEYPCKSLEDYQAKYVNKCNQIK